MVNNGNNVWLVVIYLHSPDTVMANGNNNNQEWAARDHDGQQWLTLANHGGWWLMAMNPRSTTLIRIVEIQLFQ